MSPIAFAGTTILESLDEIVDSRHTALVVYDALHHTVDQLTKDEPAFLPRWARLLFKAREVGMPIVFTRHRPDARAAGGPWLRYRMRLAGVTSPADLVEFSRVEMGDYEIVDSLKPRPAEPVFDKHFNSAFAGTGLAEWLRRQGLATIVLTGVATESGIETTCREALIEGFYVVVPADCVASVHVEMHQASLRYMRRCADVTDSDQLVASWDRARSV